MIKSRNLLETICRFSDREFWGLPGTVTSLTCSTRAFVSLELESATRIISGLFMAALMETLPCWGGASTGGAEAGCEDDVCPVVAGTAFGWVDILAGFSGAVLALSAIPLVKMLAALIKNSVQIQACRF